MKKNQQFNKFWCTLLFLDFNYWPAFNHLESLDGQNKVLVRYYMG
jgi:hypothetical protein